MKSALRWLDYSVYIQWVKHRQVRVNGVDSGHTKNTIIINAWRPWMCCWSLSPNQCYCWANTPRVVEGRLQEQCGFNQSLGWRRPSWSAPPPLSLTMQTAAAFWSGGPPMQQVLDIGSDSISNRARELLNCGGKWWGGGLSADTGKREVSNVRRRINSTVNMQGKALCVSVFVHLRVYCIHVLRYDEWMDMGWRFFFFSSNQPLSARAGQYPDII